MEEKKTENTERILPKVIEEEMQSSYLDYSMSVIVSRALPDVRDGLKPVHRRILYAMYKMKMFHNKPFKKSARIVGEVLGKYHPHGDSAVYDSMVRMAQGWSLRYPLVQGQGNFGSIDGDSPAAMRYTEARLGKIAAEMLQDIDKKTVRFVPNFDASLKEPFFLPAKLPNLLINGSSGIAVGMATNIPPHNLSEVIDGAVMLINNPEATVKDLMQVVKGPDFPTGGSILGRSGIKNAFSKGKGRLIVRAKTKIEEGKKRKKIIITEIPYMVNKTSLIEEIASLVIEKKVNGIKDIRDESDRDGMRIVVILKKEANEEIVLNQLYKHTRMQTTFGANMLALADGTPKVMNLKDMLSHYIKHRKSVIIKRTKYDLKNAEDRAHIVEGLLIALKDIDKVVETVKKSKNVSVAKSALISSFNLSEKQAQAILEMRLQRLTGLEQEKLKKEHEDLLKTISELKEILESEKKVREIIKEELSEIKDKYGDERRTEIVEGELEDIDVQDLIKPEDMVITISHSGYIKRIPVTTYKSQKRGGKGVIAAKAREEDFIEDLFIANTHNYLMFFTNKGKVKWLKVYEIPEASRQAKGTAIVNLMKFSEGEKVTAYVAVGKFEGYLMMATDKGIVKKTPLDLFSRPRAGGITAINLKEGEELVSVRRISGGEQLMIASMNGMAVKFSEGDVNSMGRTARGVRGIKLKKGDEVVGMIRAKDEDCVLTVTEKGYGKRTVISDYRLVKRGGVGVKNIICSDRNGKVVGIQSVTDNDGLMFISQKGIVIRVDAKDISKIGRATQGVRLMRIGDDDKVVGLAKVIEE